MTTYQASWFFIPLYSKPSRKWQQRFLSASQWPSSQNFVAVSILLDLTAPAVGLAPPKKERSFSVKVVFPHWWEWMAKKFLRFWISSFPTHGNGFQACKVVQKVRKGFMNDDFTRANEIKNHFSYSVLFFSIRNFWIRPLRMRRLRNLINRISNQLN